MKFMRFISLLVLGLVFLGLSTNVVVKAQGNVFVAGTHEDLKGAVSYLAAIACGNNTVWNAYVWDGMHPSLYGVTTLGRSPFPSLAADFAPVTSFTPEGDFFVNTVKLLQNFKWNDGSDVTADDVAFTFNSFLQTLKSGPSAGKSFAVAIGLSTTYNAEFVDRVEAVDKTTVKFFFKKDPGLGTWEFGALGSPILQQSYWQPKIAAALASDDPKKTLCSTAGSDEPSAGPFKFKQWQPGSFAEVAKNSSWSFTGEVFTEYKNPTGDIVGAKDTLPANLKGAVEPRQSGTTSGEGVSVALQTTEGPFVDGVVYKLFGSQALAAQAVISGDVDYHFNPLGYGLAILNQLQAAAPAVKVIKNADNGLFYLSFNMRKTPFNYLGYRKAVQCVVDKEFVANQLLNGLVTPTYSPTPPGQKAFFRNLTPEEQQEACVGMSEADRLAKAKQFLTADGFQFNSQGRLVKDPAGNPINELQLLHPNAAYDNNRNIFGLHIVDRLNKLGVPVRDVPAGFNNIVDLVFTKQDFDMWQLGWRLSSYPPSDLWDQYNSVNAVAPNDAAQGGVCSTRENAANGCQDKFDKLSSQGLNEKDLGTAEGLARQMQKLVFDNVAYVETHNTLIFDSFRADRVNWQGLQNTTVFDGLQGGDGYRDLVQKTTK